jgi:hypothetical protein
MRPRCSALLSCPIQSAFERIGKEPSHPSLDPDTNYSKLLLFEEGRRTAEVWQEAISWYCARHNILCSHEQDVSTDTLAGRIDTLVHPGRRSSSDGCIIEYKRTDYGFSQKYAYQWAGYAHNTGIEYGFIVAQSRKDSVITTCAWEGGYWTFTEENGNVVFTLTLKELQSEIQRHVAITELIQSGGMPEAPEDWKTQFFCVAQRKPEELRPRIMKSGPDKGEVRAGRETPACQYYGYCYGRFGNDYDVVHNDEGFLTYVEREVD